LGAPYWKDRARAALTGMSLATTRADVARAALESIALQIADVFAAMERDLGAPLALLSVDGGATRNELLMQLQADLLGRPVKRIMIQELSAFGAGLMAGVAAGLIDETKVETNLEQSSDVVAGHLDEAARDNKINAWRAAIRSVIANSATHRVG